MNKPIAKKSMLSRFIPFISSLAKRGTTDWLVIVGALLVVCIIFMTSVSPWLVPRNPSAISDSILQPPSAQFPLGTDDLGRDMLSRVIAGGSTMLQVAVLSVFICVVLGVPFGLFASYVGGVADRLFCLVMDSVYAFPGLVLAIAISAMLGAGVVNMALSMGVVYVPSYFRVIRSQVLSIKEMVYVEAAKTAGAKRRTILFKYILPNVVPSIAVVATVNFADAILTAAGLTFVGLGVSIDIPDWGWDLTNGRRLLLSGNWWVITFPGIMIILLALGFTFMGEGLSEILNPRLEQ